jgi:predicted N-formylglutamate amidohydrolase
LFGVDRHCHGQAIAGCGLEIADDMLATETGREAWADRLAAALRILADSGFAA